MQKEVIEPLRTVRGLILLKFEIKATSVEENVKNLANLLQDGDTLVSAGGDGTASIGLNAAITSGKKVCFSALPYGNFNDMSRMLKTKDIAQVLEKKETKKFYPLEIFIDGKFWRYAGCYATAGLFAESTEIFDNRKIRKNLQKNKKRLIFSVFSLADWYFKNHQKREFLPNFKINGKNAKRGTTDYLAINGRTVARVMRGGKYFEDSGYFLSGTAKLRSLPKLLVFMAKAMTTGVGGEKSNIDILEFELPSDIEIQVEGEYRRFNKISKIEIKKSDSFVLY